MLTTDQMSNLEDAERDCNNKQILLNTAIDVQAVLRILVDKEIVSRDEVEEYRRQVRSSPKYKSMQDYIDQTIREINVYKNNPQLLLKDMLNRKINNQ